MLWYTPGTCSNLHGFYLYLFVYVCMQRHSLLIEVAACVQKTPQPKQQLSLVGQKQGSAGPQTKAPPPLKTAQVAAPAVVQVLPLLHCMLGTGRQHRLRWYHASCLSWVHVCMHKSMSITSLISGCCATWQAKCTMSVCLCGGT